MLGRYLARGQRALQLWDIKPKNCHDEGEQHSREEPEILGLLVEARGVLEDAEAAGPEGH